jgi:amidase
MKRIPRDKFVPNLDPHHVPRAHVESGESLIVETWDAFMGAWGVGESPQHAAAVTGPIYVHSAKPGNVLKVELLKIEPKALQPGKAALHNISAGHGFLGDDFTRHTPTVMQIEGGMLRLPNGIALPMDPSLGYIATTFTEARATSSDSGPYGGDIDMKELVAGSTIWLPVFVEGALLCLGDIHARLGDGAVGGTGAECAGEVHIRVSVETHRTIARPQVLTPDHFITVCYGEDVGEAMRQAVRDMVDHLVKEKGMPPYDAYALASLAGDVRINRTFRPVSPVKMMLQRQALEQVDRLRTT